MLQDGGLLYQEIVHTIKENILHGVYRSGDQLLPTTKYVKNNPSAPYIANPATVAKAYQILVNEEIVVYRRGVGVFVTDDALAKLKKELRANFDESFIVPMINRARALDIPDSELFLRIARLMEEQRVADSSDSKNFVDE